MLARTHSNALSGAKAQTIAAATSAILLGFALWLAVGFSPLAEVHNATHDTRHASGFPCH